MSKKKPSVMNNPKGNGKPTVGSFFYNAPEHLVVCSPFFKADDKTATSQSTKRKPRVMAKK